MSTQKVSSNMIASLDASKLTGSLPAGMAPDPDLTPLQNDLAILALHHAIAENKSAHSLQNSWIEQFEDSNFITDLTDTSRNVDEYVSAVSSVDGALSASGTLLNTGHDNTRADSYIAGHAGTGYVAQGLWVAPHTKIIIESVHGWSYGTGGGGEQGKQYFSLDDSGALATVPPSIPSDYWQVSYNSVPAGSMIPFTTYGGGDLEIDNLDGSTNLKIWWVYHANGFNGGMWRGKNTGVTVAGQYWNPSGDNTTTKLGAAVNTAIAGPQNVLDLSNDEVFGLNIQGKSQSRVVTASATGSFTSTAISPQDGSNKSSLGLVLLYKDNAGTNTLNTDLVAQVSADNGVTYSNCVLAPKGTFSAGIKTAIAPAVDVTSGNQLKYKISFANQAQGTKEARVHGVSLQY